MAAPSPPRAVPATEDIVTPQRPSHEEPCLPIVLTKSPLMSVTAGSLSKGATRHRPLRMQPPSPRNLRLEVREQKKRSIITSASIDFTALSACDIEMMQDCQSGQKLQESSEMDPQKKRPRPASRTSTPSDQKSSASLPTREVSLAGLGSCLEFRIKDPHRPQSSRGGSIQGSMHSSLGQLSFSAIPPAASAGSIFGRPTSAISRANSLGSLGSLGGYAGATNLPTETPPSAPTAFEPHGSIVEAPKRPTLLSRVQCVRFISSSEADSEVDLRCFSSLSCSADSSHDSSFWAAPHPTQG